MPAVSLEPQTVYTPTPESEAKVRDFLLGEHSPLTPKASLEGILWAALAMETRGPTGRSLKDSDAYDVAHVSSFLPYMDVFTADGYFAALCNRPRIALGKRFSTEILSVPPSEIPAFIAKVEGWRASVPQAALTRRIDKAIAEGGAEREADEAMRRYLERRGVDADAVLTERRRQRPPTFGPRPPRRSPTHEE